MSNYQELNHLATWCARYFEKTEIRIHPQTVPINLVLDEILGRLEVVEAALALYTAQTSQDNKRLNDVVDRVGTAEKKIEQKRRVIIRKEVKNEQ